VIGDLPTRSNAVLHPLIADECVSRHVVERLRSKGFDVAWIARNRPGITDAEIIRTAAKEDRVLITEDRDFGELVIRQRYQIRGVVLMELDRLTSAAEADRVAAILLAHSHRLDGNLIVIEPTRVRIRPLSQ
jgi:predicted nuclease of predicted toxin-antitoxin system